MSKYVLIYNAIKLIIMSCLFLPVSANSTTILIDSNVSGYAFDGGNGSHSGAGQTDGIFDGLGIAEDIFIRKISGTGSQSFNFFESRGAYEFQLQAKTVVATDLIESVLLKYTTSHISATADDFIKIYGYSADGQIQLSDFSQTEFLVAESALARVHGDHISNYSIDITNYFTSNFDKVDYAGFVFAVSDSNVFATLEPIANLEITYTETSNVPLPSALLLFLSGGGFLSIALKKATRDTLMDN